jgi:hypothetical protein
MSLKLLGIVTPRKVSAPGCSNPEKLLSAGAILTLSAHAAPGEMVSFR